MSSDLSCISDRIDIDYSLNTGAEYVKPTTKAEMALRGMFELALGTPSKPVALAKLAEKQSVSLSYLEQVFALLRKEGLVLSVRGPGGGYLLARSADTIFADEIIHAVEGGKNATYPGNGEAVDVADARLHDFWQSTHQNMMNVLSHVSLRAVVDGSFSQEVVSHNSRPQAAE